MLGCLHFAPHPVLHPLGPEDAGGERGDDAVGRRTQIVASVSAPSQVSESPPAHSTCVNLSFARALIQPSLLESSAFSGALLCALDTREKTLKGQFARAEEEKKIWPGWTSLKEISELVPSEMIRDSAHSFYRTKESVKNTSEK